MPAVRMPVMPWLEKEEAFFDWFVKELIVQI